MKTCSSPCTVTLDCVGAEEVEVQPAMGDCMNRVLGNI